MCLIQIPPPKMLILLFRGSSCVSQGLSKWGPGVLQGSAARSQHTYLTLHFLQLILLTDYTTFGIRGINVNYVIEHYVIVFIYN